MQRRLSLIINSSLVDNTSTMRAMLQIGPLRNIYKL